MKDAGCHAGAESGAVDTASPRLALAGSPNAGKTSIFNALTGLHAKTGNYPGVTVSRFVGTMQAGERRYLIEDLPGTYSLDPISPDEQIMVDVLDGRLDGEAPPDALLVVVDATTLRRSLRFVAQVLRRGLPTCLVVTFTDEMTVRQGRLDLPALQQALGVPVVQVLGNRGQGIDQLRDQIERWPTWSTPTLPPPDDPAEADAWAESVLSFAGYRAPQRHRITQRVDAVLLHPLWGTIVFLAVMVLFFQTVFTLAAPCRATWRRSSDGCPGWWPPTSATRGWPDCSATRSSAASARCSCSYRRSCCCSC